MGVLSSMKSDRPAGGARSPEREAVAAALNELVGAARAMGVTKSTVSRARDLRDQTADRHAAASTAASAAKTEHAAAMLHSARSGEGVGVAAGYRELRHAAADAADDLEAATSALETAEQEYADAEYAAREVKKRVSDAADGVLLAELPGQIARVRAAIEGLTLVCEPLDFIRRLQSGPVELRGTAQALVENIRGFVQKVSGRFIDYPDAAEWSAARQALMDNPDAPLPSLGSVE